MDFFIPPLAPAKLIKMRLAHTARGFCWLLHSTGKPRSILDLPFALGLTKQLTFSHRDAQHDMPSEVRHQILWLLCRDWQLSLSDINTQFIELCFRQLAPHRQLEAMSLIVSQLESRKDLAMKLNEAGTVPADVLDRLKMSLASLEQALIDKDPMMPQHLRNSHSILISYPETVHLLEDSEIAKLIDAAEIHTKTQIVKAVASGSAKGGSKKKVSVDDL
jgi:hypothetical protein